MCKVSFLCIVPYVWCLHTATIARAEHYILSKTKTIKIVHLVPGIIAFEDMILLVEILILVVTIASSNHSLQNIVETARLLPNFMMFSTADSFDIISDFAVEIYCVSSVTYHWPPLYPYSYMLSVSVGPVYSKQSQKVWRMLMTHWQTCYHFPLPAPCTEWYQLSKFVWIISYLLVE